jgi:hypothetical protein
MGLQIKQNPNGSVERLKPCLVAKGYALTIGYIKLHSLTIAFMFLLIAHEVEKKPYQIQQVWSGTSFQITFREIFKKKLN